MHVLIDSPVFWPSVGGIEIVSENLAQGLIELGHEVTLLTRTETDRSRQFSFPVYRRPSIRQQLELVKSHDIVFSNGTSALLFPWCYLFQKPFVWTHATYRFQTQSNLPIRKRIAASLKTFVRKIIASMVDKNIAISQHMLVKQPLPNQVVIPNPVNTQSFKGVPEDPLPAAVYTFGFLGRLVTDKGVHILLDAFAKLLKLNPCQGLSLGIIGDGDERSSLIELSKDLGLSSRVHWLGKKEGDELVVSINQCGIFVIPSLWEEPMGLVAVELMAAGHPLIVSSKGGLSECAGDSCLSVPNGDSKLLAAAMQKLLNDSKLMKQFVVQGISRAGDFSIRSISCRYESMFIECIRKRRPKSNI